MKLPIYDQTNKKVGEHDIPEQFSEEIRVDLIQRAVVAKQKNDRQPYGAKSDAGMRHSAELSRRRRDYRGSYGIGISRVPRKILTRSGTRMNWVGAVAPGTVGGRRAHPPKPTKDHSVKINKKERRKAIRSALHATILADMVKNRGHAIPDAYPFLISKGIESISKTKELKEILKTLWFFK